MMSKTFQKGFAILPILLVITLLAVSAVSTYFVINQGTGGFISRASISRMVPPECSGIRLAKGTSASSSVKNWQTYLTKDLEEKVVVDGVFGNQTLAAVKKYQEKYEVPVTGFIDLATCQKRNELEGGTNVSVTPPVVTDTPTSAYVLPPICDKGKSLRSGMPQDTAVTNWQNFFNSVEGETLTVGTTYNAQTIEATKRFQKKYKITVDGIIGPQTCGQRVKVEATITPSVTVTVPPDEPSPTVTDTPPDITIHPTIPVNPAVGKVELSFVLSTQGITKELTNSQELPFQVKLKGPTNTEYSSGILTAKADKTWSGDVTFENVKSGTGYTIYVKAGKHIQKKVCVVAPNESVAGTYNCKLGSITLQQGKQSFDFSRILLLAGDLPIGDQQDGQVNAQDIAFILNHKGSTEPDDLEIGDLNFDGIIDTQDMSLIVQSLNVKYDDE